MKLRALAYGIPVTHTLITPLTDLTAPVSISDYDAFVFDPNVLSGRTFPGHIYHRRTNELSQLVKVKGGLVVCYLQPSQPANFSLGTGASVYDLLREIIPASLQPIQQFILPGTGSQVKLLPNARGILGSYVSVLKDHLYFTASFTSNESTLSSGGGAVFAVNSVGLPIAVEFSVSTGRVCFVPVPQGVSGDRVGSALFRLIDAHFGGPAEIEKPPWVNEVTVPGANSHDDQIAQLEYKGERVAAEIAQLTQVRADLLDYRSLLYGYGTSLLEPVVRRAFRLFGFDVPEPDTYDQEWDVALTDPRNEKTAIGEVEGSGGPIDVDKYRQLLDYFQSEVLEGRIHKGILIGNGYRQLELNAPEREAQFSQHALNGARANGFCLVPTTELFKAVCTVLESSADEGLKIEIRDSILATVGVWTFLRGSKSDPKDH